jgi:uncharacterized protein DUF3501
MKHVERSEILPLGEYEQIRSQFRARVMDEKKRRRASIGDKMSLVFENRDTVLLQVQEMLRTERITGADAIGHELETYNELVPGDDELSMTLFIEVPDRDTREKLLRECAGMEDQVALEVDGTRCPAAALARDGATADRTTAVQYYKIALPHDLAERWRRKEVRAVAVVVDHPAYRHRVELGPEAVAALGGDLSWSS